MGWTILGSKNFGTTVVGIFVAGLEATVVCGLGLLWRG